MEDKVRVFEIAEEANVTSSEVIYKASDLKIVLKSPQSSVSFNEAEEIYDYITTGKSHQLKQNSKQNSINIMKEWFNKHYAEPSDILYFDNTTNDYTPIFGKLISPINILTSRYNDIIKEEYIILLSEELSKISSEWSPLPKNGISSINYDNMINTINSNEKIIKTFDESIASIELLSTLHIKNNHQIKHLNFMLYANIFTSLENLLSDSFYFNIHDNKLYQQKFIESSGLFAERIKASDIYEFMNNITYKIYEKLGNKVWHAFNDVKKYYQGTFDIEIDIKYLESKVQIRHDIVHRNGKTTKTHDTIINEDNYHSITLENINELILEAKKIRNLLYENFHKDSLGIFSIKISKSIMTNLEESLLTNIQEPKQIHNDYHSIGKKYKNRK